MVSGPRLLMICTANQCRSPLAEFLFRKTIQGAGLDWQVSSAGTHARAGLAMHPYTERLLTGRGLDVSGWTTTAVTEELLDGSDLVLTATRQHSSYLVAALPRLRPKIIPLRRFARIAESARQARAWSLTDDLSILLDIAGRPGVPGAGDADDLADPVGQPYRRFKASARLIDESIESIMGSATDERGVSR